MRHGVMGLVVVAARSRTVIAREEGAAKGRRQARIVWATRGGLGAARLAIQFQIESYCRMPESRVLMPQRLLVVHLSRRGGRGGRDRVEVAAQS